MQDIIDRYHRHADSFERRTAAVTQEQWDNQSPCAKWTARDVVGHIVMMHSAMLSPIGLQLGPAPDLGDDPLAAFRAARADVEAILGDPGQATKPVNTPDGRTMTFAEHVDHVVSDDMVLHGWDLAMATDQDPTMDPDDVARILAGTRSMAPEVLEMMRTPGAFGPDIEVFGPEVKVGDDAAPQDRLLGMIGRDPRWTRP
jgi:uncharacterized protein (TIGR03086 family)